jgi:hypothetical protein
MLFSSCFDEINGFGQKMKMDLPLKYPVTRIAVQLVRFGPIANWRFVIEIHVMQN